MKVYGFNPADTHLYLIWTKNHPPGLNQMENQMAGTPGKSGGKRAGAGRKPEQVQKLAIPVPVADTLAHKDPKVFLLALMNDLEADVKVRADAAKALMPFMHAKLGEGGKKDQQQDAAKKVAGGKFAAAAPPRLVTSNGR